MHIKLNQLSIKKFDGIKEEKFQLRRKQRKDLLRQCNRKDDNSSCTKLVTFWKKFRR